MRLFAVALLVILYTVAGWPSAAADKKVVQLNNEGVTALKDDSFDLAISKLEEALRIDPAYAIGRENLSIAYNNYALKLAKDPAAASRLFRKALFVEPSNATTRQNLETCLSNLHKNPRSFDDRIALGDAAMAEKEYVGAAVEYQAALQLKEDGATRDKLAKATVLAQEQMSKPEAIPHTEPVHVDEKYAASVYRQLDTAWVPPKMLGDKSAILQFRLKKDGSVSAAKLLVESGDPKVDASVMQALMNAQPFGKLPAGSEDEVTIQYTFAKRANSP